MNQAANWLNAEKLEALIVKSRQWIDANVLNWTSLIQLAVIAAALALAVVSAPALRRLVRAAFHGHRYESQVARMEPAVLAIIVPVAWLILLTLATIAAERLALPWWMLDVASSLLTAWIIIRIAAAFIRNPTWARTFAVVAWTVAALDVVDLLDPMIGVLEAASITMGDLRLSAWGFVKGVVTLIVFLWAATFLSRLLEPRINALSDLTPSIQVLFAKLLKIVLVTVAVVAALSSVGIDLTAFAVFSGAVGVGLGFGLQKVVANLISGIILLVDKSVKPGDVIAVADYFGRIDTLNARYVSVITRDGIEHLIPNEDLIAQRVENWSYSNELLRLRRPVGISYDSDLRLAIRLCLEACDATPRVLKEPKPVCLVSGFGDSSVNLEMRFWIKDPMNGRANVTSEVYLGVWDRFHEHGIKIPFPQRDLHLVSPERLRVTREAPAAE